MSGVELTEAERADLLRAWPWPVEAATTTTGFADVVAAVERIKARARAEGAREAREADAAALEDHTDCDCEDGDHVRRLASPAWLRVRAASAVDQGEEGRP